MRLAQEIRADWVLIDERLARRVAQVLGLPVKGSMGVLLAAHRAGLMTRAECLGATQTLLHAGIRVSPGVIAWLEQEVDRS